MPFPYTKGKTLHLGKGQASSPPQRASLFAAGKGTPLSVIRANIHAYPITIFQCFHPSSKSLTFSCSSFPKKQILIWYTLQKIPWLYIENTPHIHSIFSMKHASNSTTINWSPNINPNSPEKNISPSKFNLA